MGFITPSHTWEETDTELIVRVEIKGVPRASFDVFAASCYLKVNAPPYLFSCDLEGEIDDAQCIATIGEEGVEFKCPKLKQAVNSSSSSSSSSSSNPRWGRLKRQVSAATKSEITERRRKSVEAAHARVVAERLAAREAKKKAEKAYLEKQWEIEQNRKKTIEDRQDAEMDVERERRGRRRPFSFTLPYSLHVERRCA